MTFCSCSMSLSSCFWKNRQRKHTLLPKAWTCSLGSGTGRALWKLAPRLPSVPSASRLSMCPSGIPSPRLDTRTVSLWFLSVSLSPPGTCLSVLVLCVQGGAREGAGIQEEGGRHRVGSAGGIAPDPPGAPTLPQASVSASLSHYCSRKKIKNLRGPHPGEELGCACFLHQ